MATTLVDEDVQSLNARIEELRAELALAEVARASYMPEEPTEVGSVVRFSKYNFGYTFAAIKVPNGLWYITQDGRRTSRQGHAPKTWGELLTWIGERNWHRIEVLS
jgi:hypothetical protein